MLQDTVKVSLTMTGKFTREPGASRSHFHPVKYCSAQVSERFYPIYNSFVLSELFKTNKLFLSFQS